MRRKLLIGNDFRSQAIILHTPRWWWCPLALGCPEDMLGHSIPPFDLGILSVRELSFLWFNQSDDVVSARLTGALEKEVLVFHPPNTQAHRGARQAVPTPDGFQNLLSRPVGDLFPTLACRGCKLWKG